MPNLKDAAEDIFSATPEHQRNVVFTAFCRYIMLHESCNQDEAVKRAGIYITLTNLLTADHLEKFAQGQNAKNIAKGMVN